MRITQGVGRAIIRAAAITLAGMPMSSSMTHAQDGPTFAKSATALTVGEGFDAPLGYHSAVPTFSWRLPDGVVKQAAYRLEAKTGGDTWDSGWVESAQSTFVPYGGRKLKARDRVSWRVNVRDDRGQESGWSHPTSLELGLLTNADWQARWIKPNTPADRQTESVANLRRTFTFDKPIASARVYVTARGLFELRLNGQPVSRDYFANGWTSYKKRIDTLTYDVTRQVKAGDNAIEAMVGKGWYAGRIGWAKDKGHFGQDAALLLQLEVQYEDGTSATINSDKDWQATWNGPVVTSSIYDGETYDARKAPGDWQPVTVEPDLGTARLTPKPFAPVRHTDTIAAKTVTEPKPGHFVFDLGQNMVGWAKLKMAVEKDKTVTIRFSEMLNPDGTPYTAAYRSAKSTDTYTAATTGTVEWQPHFTFHGFRYVELSGLPDGSKPDSSWVTGVVLHSDLPRAGTFTSSHAKLNQLQSNITWGQRSNFVDIPTDCPQRDERLGWTGDAQVFAATSMFNYDSHAFWKSWLGTMRDDQAADGEVPFVIPNVIDGGCPGWMEAATIIPWDVYVRTGDVAMLADNYAMMEKLANWYRTKAVEGVKEKQWFVGDWLQPYAPDNSGETTKTLIGSAFQTRNVQILADSARVLGKTNDVKRYSEEAADLAKKFAAKYFDADGKLQNATETQTSYLLAIAFDLIPKEMKPKAVENLVRTVHEADDHLRTGFLGTPFIVRILDDYGHTDLAFKVLLNETYPGWFYSINQGATTMWERWNSYSHDKGFGNVEMNSFNHYAYGAIGQWMYERLAGLTPDAAHPGYKHFFVRPLVSGPIDSARAELHTPYGLAVSGWKKEGDQVTLDVVVPPNTTATVRFPDGRADETVSAGTHRYTCGVAKR